MNNLQNKIYWVIDLWTNCVMVLQAPDWQEPLFFLSQIYPFFYLF